MKKNEMKKAKEMVVQYYSVKDLALEIDNLIKRCNCSNVRKAGEYMVEGGCFAIYYDDQRKELAEIFEQTDVEAKKYNNEKVFLKYKDVVAQAIEKILK